MSCADTSRPESVGEGKQGSEWVKRSLRGSLLGFPMNLDALPDDIFAWCWRRLLGRRLALGSAQWRHSSRGRRGHPATVTGGQVGRWNTHGVFFRWGGAGLGLREDDAFFFAGVRRVATMVRSEQLGWWCEGLRLLRVWLSASSGLERRTVLSALVIYCRIIYQLPL